MSHQDLEDSIKGDCLKEALRWLLAGISWSSVKFRDDCSYTPRLLACTAMLWAWSNEPTLGDRFKATRSIIEFLFSLQHRLAGSYQSFIKLLHRWTGTLVALVQVALQQRMQQSLGSRWEVCGFVVFGVDGSGSSCLEPGRTKRPIRQPAGASRRSVARSRNHVPRNTPRRPIRRRCGLQPCGTQVRACLGIGEPVRPTAANEPTCSRCLPALPGGALIAADAGFVGYEYAKAVIDSGRELLVRVGSNVRLLRKLGLVREFQGTVYLWPDQQAKKDQPPIVLRMVVAQNGKHPVYLVTSVCTKSRLSDSQVIELYRRRWGIEVFYRHFKQTFGRRKLRSNSADNAHIEIEWSLVGLWAMALYALVQTTKQGLPPNRLSIAETLRNFRNTLRDYRHPRERKQRLRSQLRHRSYRSVRPKRQNQPRLSPQETRITRGSTPNRRRQQITNPTSKADCCQLTNKKVNGVGCYPP